MPGPAPKTLESWIRRVGRDHEGPKKLRVTREDSSQQLVRFTTAPKTIAIVQQLQPTRVEALDEEGTILAQFDVPESDEIGEIPGYMKESGDSEPERLLKTFAHLLADAHRLANKQLVEVVSIQSQHFAEERRHLVGLRLQNEKLMAQAIRGANGKRVRVAPDGSSVEEEESDDFMSTFLAPFLQRMVQQRMAAATAGEAGDDAPDEPVANGKDG